MVALEDKAVVGEGGCALQALVKYPQNHRTEAPADRGQGQDVMGGEVCEGGDEDLR